MKHIANYWKEWAGVLLKDTPRYLPALYGRRRAGNGDPAWVALRNRNEQLEVNPQGRGVRCLWQWSSRLHACQVFRSWGTKLQQRCLAEWPIHLSDRPHVVAQAPQISFLFAHAGHARVPQLRQVIRSVLAQQEVAVECIVVDLTPQPIAAELPAGTVCRHVPTDHLPQGWYKSWAYNIAARMARSDILVFHDGDICLPARYAAELQQLFASGNWDAASLQRFLFYLTPDSTERFLASGRLPRVSPQHISQNWKGGTIAVRREAFFQLGGYDEGFVDWGGEDDEFYDRCGELRHCRYGYIPFVHLWHEPQALKHSADNRNELSVLPARLAIPRTTRIGELCHRSFGDVDRPDPLVAYKDQPAYSQQVELTAAR